MGLTDHIFTLIVSCFPLLGQTLADPCDTKPKVSCQILTQTYRNELSSTVERLKLAESGLYPPTEKTANALAQKVLDEIPANTIDVDLQQKRNAAWKTIQNNWLRFWADPSKRKRIADLKQGGIEVTKVNPPELGFSMSQNWCPANRDCSTNHNPEFSQTVTLMESNSPQITPGLVTEPNELLIHASDDNPRLDKLEKRNLALFRQEDFLSELDDLRYRDTREIARATIATFELATSNPEKKCADSLDWLYEDQRISKIPKDPIQFVPMKKQTPSLSVRQNEPTPQAQNPDSLSSQTADAIDFSKAEDYNIDHPSGDFAPGGVCAKGQKKIAGYIYIAFRSDRDWSMAGVYGSEFQANNPNCHKMITYYNNHLVAIPMPVHGNQ